MIYVLNDERCYPQLGFRTKAKMDFLLEDPDFKKIYNPDKIEPSPGDKLLVTVHGNVFLKRQKDKEHVYKCLEMFKRFKPQDCFIVVEDRHPYSMDWSNFYDAYGEWNVLTLYKNITGEGEYNVDLHPNVFWIPHHIDEQIFKPYETPKRNHILLWGAVDRRAYPDRYEIFKYFDTNASDQTIDFLPHPAIYGKNPSLRHDTNREKLARLISEDLMALATPSKYNYCVAKYFEVLMCGTIPLGVDCPDSLELGIKTLHYTNYKYWAGYPLEEQVDLVRSNFGLPQYLSKMKNTILNA